MSDGKGVRGGWSRNGGKESLRNQGDLSWCRGCRAVRSRLSLHMKEQGRSQSPHSSEEASNDRGAKGGRKVDTERKH